MKLYIGAAVKIGLLLLVSRSDACLDLLVRSFNEIFTPVIETSENRVHKSHRVDDLTKFYKRDKNGNFVLRDDKWLAANPFVKSSKVRDKYKPTGRSLFEHLNLRARTPVDEEGDNAYPWLETANNGDYGESDSVRTGAEEEVTTLSSIVEYETTNKSNVSIPVERVGFREWKSSADDDQVSNARKIQIGVQDYEYGDDYSDMKDDVYPNDGGPKYYVPGDRPVVDLLIKILEMFQVGLEASPNYIVSPPKDKTTKSKSKIKFRSSNESDYDN